MWIIFNVVSYDFQQRTESSTMRRRTILAHEIVQLGSFRTTFDIRNESISLKILQAISFELSILLHGSFLCETTTRIYRIFSSETSDSKNAAKGQNRMCRAIGREIIVHIEIKRLDEFPTSS